MTQIFCSDCLAIFLWVFLWELRIWWNYNLLLPGAWNGVLKSFAWPIDASNGWSAQPTGLPNSSRLGWSGLVTLHNAILFSQSRRAGTTLLPRSLKGFLEGWVQPSNLTLPPLIHPEEQTKRVEVVVSDHTCGWSGIWNLHFHQGLLHAQPYRHRSGGKECRVCCLAHKSGHLEIVCWCHTRQVKTSKIILVFNPLHCWCATFWIKISTGTK